MCHKLLNYSKNSPNLYLKSIAIFSVFLFVVVVLIVLGIELRASHLLGR
jgi:hypothetical protein